MDQKEKILKIIDNCNLMIGDIKTFIWLRSIRRDDYKSQSFGVGGGNFLMILGCLSIIYFFAKIYYFLAGEETVDKFRDKETERKALEYFISKTKIWDLNEDQLKQIREVYRNSLAHAGVPIKPIWSIEYIFPENHKETDFNIVLDHLKIINDPSFTVQNKKISAVNTDLLFRDVLKMKEKLIEQIKLNSFKEKNISLLLAKLAERGIVGI